MTSISAIQTGIKDSIGAIDAAARTQGDQALIHLPESTIASGRTATAPLQDILPEGVRTALAEPRTTHGSGLYAPETLGLFRAGLAQALVVASVAARAGSIEHVRNAGGIQAVAGAEQLYQRLTASSMRDQIHGAIDASNAATYTDHSPLNPLYWGSGTKASRREDARWATAVSPHLLGLSQRAHLLAPSTDGPVEGTALRFVEDAHISVGRVIHDWIHGQRRGQDARNDLAAADRALVSASRGTMPLGMEPLAPTVAAAS